MIEIDEILWVAVLRQQCKAASQKQVAKEIGYSAGAICQVLSGKYKGDLNRVERAVRGAYLGDTVVCPVLGELQANVCIEHQRRPYAATNRQRVQLYRACRNGCPYSEIKKEIKP